MKVAIIGGGGLVGSSAGFALQAGGIVREIALVDVNRDMADGQALDLMHGSSLIADQRITGGGTELAVRRGHRRDHGGTASQAGRKPPRSDQPQCGAVPQHSGRPQKTRHEKGGDGLRRLQSGRRAHVSGREGIVSRPAARLRLGDDARHDAAAGHSGAATERAADAGLGHDAGRARRQHGGHLVGRPDCRLAARQMARAFRRR